MSTNAFVPISACLINGFFLFMCTASGQQQTTVRHLLSPVTDWSDSAGGNLCGIYSVSRALQLLGDDIQPIDLWDARYVGSTSGSSPDELVLAVKNFGANSVLASNLTCFDVLAVECPLIANVRSSVDRNVFDHWVCVVPDRTGLLVYDGPAKAYSISNGEFLSIWNGVGIFVSKQKSVWFWFIGARAVLLTTLLLIASSILARTHQRFQALAALPAAATFGITFGFVLVASSATFQYVHIGESHSRAVKAALMPFKKCSTQVCSMERLQVAAHDPSILLVDARMERDFKRSTIPNAVNIPVTASLDRISGFVGEIPKNTEILVFCHSLKCDFDVSLATRLCLLGFSNVCISEAGYVEYMEYVK